MERCGKINAWNSVAESWTGIGVVVDLVAGVGMREWPYLKIAQMVSYIIYLQILQWLKEIGKTCNQFTVSHILVESTLIARSYSYTLSRDTTRINDPGPNGTSYISCRFHTNTVHCALMYGASEQRCLCRLRGWVVPAPCVFVEIG